MIADEILNLNYLNMNSIKKGRNLIIHRIAFAKAIRSIFFLLMYRVFEEVSQLLRTISNKVFDTIASDAYLFDNDYLDCRR